MNSSGTTPSQPQSNDDGQDSDPNVWTVRRILDWTIDHLGKSGSDSARLDAEILLAHSRGCKRIELYTRYNEVMTDEQRSAMRDLVRRRATAEPVAYLVGYREFFSLSFEVNSHVLIPRPETETLVLEAIEILNTLPAPRILEIGTGSGCIAVALAKQCPNATVVTVDVSEGAIEVAKRNAETHGVSDRIEFRQGDVFGPIAPDERFDMLVSNPPYVCNHEIPGLSADVRDHEPHLALDGGDDGLNFVRSIVVDGPKFLNPGATMLIEIDPAQVVPTCEISRPVEPIVACRGIQDLSGDLRIMILKVAGTMPTIPREVVADESDSTEDQSPPDPD